jgi:hypothetical protein
MTLRILAYRLTVLVVAALMTACSANHKSIFRHENVSSGAWITTTDAKQRAILSNDRPGESRRFCAEPSPDVFAVIAQSLSVGGTFGQQADPKAIEAALSAAFSSSEQGSMIPRTQTINMLRELMYRTCERYMNGGIASLELPLQAIRDQRLMVSILAIEQLTGAVAAKAVALGAVADANAGASVAGGMAVLEKARTEVKAKATARDEAQEAYKLKVKAKVNGTDKELEACLALDNAKTDANANALPQEIKDKASDCGKLKAALEQAEAEHKEAKAYYDKQSKLADASGIPVSATAGLMTPTALGGVDKAGGGNFGDVSEVVRSIVEMNFKQDEFLFLCLKTLSIDLSPKDTALAKELQVNCLDYVNKRINAEKSEIELQKERVDAEMGRLRAASNDQFETFWKTISTGDGTSIDLVRLQAVRQKASKLLRWPTCFVDTSTKDETRNCFLTLVPFRRQDLVKAATQP